LFKLVGRVNGGGASNTEPSGDVYNLNNVSNFAGLYTQRWRGLVTANTSDLWLQNRAGVGCMSRGLKPG